MKASSFKYLTATGLKNMWVNKLMTISSVGTLMACMIIIGVAVMLSVNINKAVKGVEQQNVISAFFNDRNSVYFGTSAPLDDSEVTAATKLEDIPDSAYLVHNEDEAKAVIAEIEKLDNVAQVRYITSEEWLMTMKEDYLSGKDAAAGEVLDELNPFSMGAKITVNDMSRFNETAAAIEKVAGVSRVRAQKDVATKLVTVRSVIKNAGAWIIGILLIISFVIVSNTIRVTMYNRKLEISIMKAVGATDSFIRLPFMIEGIAIGIISSVLAFGVMYLMQNAIMKAIGSAFSISSMVPFKSYALVLFLIFLAIGVLSGVLGSLIMMGKYLKKEGSEFRAL